MKRLSGSAGAAQVNRWSASPQSKSACGTASTPWMAWSPPSDMRAASAVNDRIAENVRNSLVFIIAIAVLRGREPSLHPKSIGGSPAFVIHSVWRRRLILGSNPTFGRACSSAGLDLRPEPVVEDGRGSDVLDDLGARHDVRGGEDRRVVADGGWKQDERGPVRRRILHGPADLRRHLRLHHVVEEGVRQ